jgi:hypothetical protein
MLAISVLIASVPIVSATARVDQRPTVTLDICHPAQVLGGASIQCAMPLPSSLAAANEPEFSAMRSLAALLVKARISDPPLDPPPKPRVYLSS